MSEHNCVGCGATLPSCALDQIEQLTAPLFQAPAEAVRIRRQVLGIYQCDHCRMRQARPMPGDEA